MNEILSGSKLRSDPGPSAAPDIFAWLHLTELDKMQTGQLGPIGAEIADDIIEGFYDHIMKFENAGRQFSSDKQIDRIKAAQKALFCRACLKSDGFCLYRGAPQDRAHP